MRPLPRTRRLWQRLPLLTLYRAMTFNVSLRSSRNAKHFAERLNKPRTRRGFRRTFIKFNRWERDVKAINRYLVVLEENFCRVFPGEKIRGVRIANWRAISWPLYPVVRVRCASPADKGWGRILVVDPTRRKRREITRRSRANTSLRACNGTKPSPIRQLLSKEKLVPDETYEIADLPSRGIDSTARFSCRMFMCNEQHRLFIQDILKLYIYIHIYSPFYLQILKDKYNEDTSINNVCHICTILYMYIYIIKR